jgi:CRP-like cAMP-binding protein
MSLLLHGCGLTRTTIISNEIKHNATRVRYAHAERVVNSRGSPGPREQSLERSCSGAAAAHASADSPGDEGTFVGQRILGCGGKGCVAHGKGPDADHGGAGRARRGGTPCGIEPEYPSLGQNRANLPGAGWLAMTDTAFQVSGEAELEEATFHADLLVASGRGHRECVAAGETLVVPGGHSTHVYVVTGGLFTVRHGADVSGTPVLTLRHPGQLVGEDSLTPEASATALVRAVTDSSVVAVRLHDLEGAFDVDRSLSLWLMQRIVRQIRSMQATKVELHSLDLTARVARALPVLAHSVGCEFRDGVAFIHGLTQSEIAMMVGANRATVSRVLARFGRLGWIQSGRGSVVVLDSDAILRRTGVRGAAEFDAPRGCTVTRCVKPTRFAMSPPFPTRVR